LHIIDSSGVTPQDPVSKGVTARFRCFGGLLDRILVWQPLLLRLAGEGFPGFQVNSVPRMHHEALIFCKSEHKSLAGNPGAPILSGV